MSEFEQTAKPLLTPIIRSQSVKWSAYEQLAVARWASKTALMIDRANRPTLHTVPDPHLRYLFEHRKPAPSVSIALGHYAPTVGEVPFAAWMGTSWASATRRNGEDIKGFRINFTIGHALFRIYGHDSVETEGIAFEGRLLREDQPVEDVFRPLWPPAHEAYEWPPQGAHFTTSGLTLLEHN